MVAHQDYSPNVNLYDTAIYEPTLAGSWVPGTYACALGDASLNKFEIIPNKDPDAGTSCVLVTDVWLSAQ